MNKQELFKKYDIKENHSEWNNNIDNWVSVEIFRIMHDGRLPTDQDTDFLYIILFSDKIRDPKGMIELMKRNDFGSLYLTSKRMIYRFQEQILEELATIKNT